MTGPTAEQIIEWFVDHLEVGPFMFGGKPALDEHGETKLALTFVMGLNPRQSYTLDIAGNSYDEACYGELGAVLNAARKLLGRPEIEIEPKALLVQKV